MPFVENLNWLNLNSLRSYPIRDNLNRIDASGTFIIPNDFIVDFSLSATSDITIKFYISQISNQIDETVLQISDSNNNVVGSFSINVAAFSNDSDYYLQTVPGQYQYANGKITIGSISSVLQQPAGIFEFTIIATEFEPRTINVSVSGINEITFLDSKGTSQSLTGNVNILARNNLRYSFNSGTNYLILDAGDGLGLNISCTTATCVQTINGIKPDPSTGNISFIGLGCSAISTDTQYTLQLNDECCTPCAGCDDLSTLTSRTNNLESNYQNLKELYNYLNTQLTAFTNTVNFNCSCPSS